MESAEEIPGRKINIKRTARVAKRENERTRDTGDESESKEGEREGERRLRGHGMDVTCYSTGNGNLDRVPFPCPTRQHDVIFSKIYRRGRLLRLVPLSLRQRGL